MDKQPDVGKHCAGLMGPMASFHIELPCKGSCYYILSFHFVPFQLIQSYKLTEKKNHKFMSSRSSFLFSLVIKADVNYSSCRRTSKVHIPINTHLTIQKLLACKILLWSLVITLSIIVRNQTQTRQLKVYCAPSEL